MVKFLQFTSSLHPIPATRHLKKRINEGVKSKIGNYYEARGYRVNFRVQPVEDIHLQSQLFEEMEINGDQQTIRYLSWACLLLLATALLNYTNLTTAKNLYRGKEVGIRKVAGAYKINLTLQYLLESLLVFASAMTLALAIVYLSVPLMQSYRTVSANPIKVLRSE